MNPITTDDSLTQDAPIVLLPTSDAPADHTTVERVEEALENLDRLWDKLTVADDYAVSPLEYELPTGFTLSIVIPVYNEEATILDVLARVRALPLSTELIVVDDCSTDRTRDRLETLRGAPGLQLVFKPQNEGKGAALRTGFSSATGEVVVIQDADLEYDPRDILSVIRPIVEGEADVVYGSRFLGEEQQDQSLMHRLLNRALTEASNLFTGLHLTDMETCYKAFRREVLSGFTLRQNRFGFEPEVTAKLARRSHQIVEKPIHYNARGYDEGKKIGMSDAFNALYCIVRYGLAD